MILGGDLKKLDEIINKYKEANKLVDETSNIEMNSPNIEEQPKVDSENNQKIYTINSHDEEEEDEEEEEDN